MVEQAPPLKMYLVGKTGAGKSSLANTILGEEVFKVDHTANASPAGFCKATRTLNGTPFTVLDTPGWFDQRRSEKQQREELAKGMVACAPGPHAFLIVLKVENHTSQEKDIIKKILDTFTADALKYAILVFTHGDNLQPDQTIWDFVHTNPDLSCLYQRCEGRCYAVDNRYWNTNQDNRYRNNQVQVAKLLNKVKQMAGPNGMHYYTNSALEKIKRCAGKFLKIAIGMTTGVLLGALLGVPVAVVAVMSRIREMPVETVVKRLRLTDLMTVRPLIPVVAKAVMAVGAIYGASKGFQEAQDAGSVYEAASNTASALLSEAQGQIKRLFDSEASNPLRIVLLGKPGSGKSSLANVILRETVFDVHYGDSDSCLSRRETRTAHGRNLTLIDGPGFFDERKSKEEQRWCLLSCLTQCSPGPHVVLIVLKVEKFTEQEQTIVTKICEGFSADVLRYSILVFTRGDQLREDSTLEGFISNSKGLTALAKKCGGRCHVFDTKYWNNNPSNEYRSNRFHLEQLLKSIDHIVLENKTGFYTNAMIQGIEKEIQQEEKNIRESSEASHQEEIRKSAVLRVFESRKKRSPWGCYKPMFYGALLLGALAVSIPLIFHHSREYLKADTNANVTKPALWSKL